jgi:hypothetical protein
MVATIGAIGEHHFNWHHLNDTIGAIGDVTVMISI